MLDDVAQMPLHHPITRRDVHQELAERPVRQRRRPLPHHRIDVVDHVEARFWRERIRSRQHLPQAFQSLRLPCQPQRASHIGSVQAIVIAQPDALANAVVLVAVRPERQREVPRLQQVIQPQ